MFDFISSLIQKAGIVIGSVFISIGGSLGADTVVEGSKQLETVRESAAQEETVTVNTDNSEVEIEEISKETARDRDESSLSAGTRTVSTPEISQKPTVIEVEDVCNNIEGIQSIVPGSYIENNGVCTPERVEDKCFNLDGTQASVPSGMMRHRTYGCISEKQLGEIEDAERLNEKCNSLVDSIKELEKEILDIEYSYQIKKEELSSGGGGSIGFNAEISNLAREEESAISPIEYERDILNLEYSAKCNQ